MLCGIQQFWFIVDSKVGLCRYYVCAEKENNNIKFNKAHKTWGDWGHMQMMDLSF